MIADVDSPPPPRGCGWLVLLIGASWALIAAVVAIGRRSIGGAHG
jgi:hypothetical protein